MKIRKQTRTGAVRKARARAKQLGHPVYVNMYLGEGYQVRDHQSSASHYEVTPDGHVRLLPF